jgi:COP9 signalosome complex subunit 3
MYFELCHQFTNALVKNKQHIIQGVQVLCLAVDKIRLRETQLTPVHADLCQLCLAAKVFNPALRFLDVDVTAIASTDDQNHDAKYFLLYYYYGGMVYAAMKNYDRALYFFEVAISTPAVAMSHIMLEAYKKYILVSLILHGKVLPIPKFSSQVITRFMKPLSHAYVDLSNAYATSSSDEVRNVINKHRDQFTRDNNMGLVKLVISSLYKKNIQRLTKTFLTLSLADVASRVQLSGPAEAEKYILNMIKSGEIFASINQKDGMVVFKDDPQQYDSPEMFDKMQAEIARVMELNKQLVKMEEEIMLNPMVSSCPRRLT